MVDFDREEEIEENEETGWKFPRFQFSLATLLWGVTGTAVLCGLIAWWGPIPVMFLLGAAAGTFLALLLCNYFGLGFGFDNLHQDLLKCLIVPGVPFGAWCLLSLLPLGFIPAWSFLIVFIFLYWVSVKCAWLDIEPLEIVISCIGALLGGSVLVALAAAVYPLH
jgi:hypothetical protein